MNRQTLGASWQSDETALTIGTLFTYFVNTPDETIAEQAKQLIKRVKLEETDTLPLTEILDIITTIAGYKFS